MKLTQDTLVPAGFVIGAIAFGVGWGTLSANMKTNSDEIDKVEHKQDLYNADSHRIDRRLSRIEGALHVRVPAEDEKSQ